jgi:hypothetical protein
MEAPADKTLDQEGTFSTVAWLLGVVVFLVAVWAAVGWAVHGLLAGAATPV